MGTFCSVQCRFKAPTGTQTARYVFLKGFSPIRQLHKVFSLVATFLMCNFLSQSQPQCSALQPIAIAHAPPAKLTLVGKLSLEKLPFGKLPLGKLPFGKLPLRKLPLRKLPLGKLTLWKLTLWMLTLWKLPLGKLLLGKLPLGESCHLESCHLESCHLGS